MLQNNLETWLIDLEKLKGQLGTKRTDFKIKEGDRDVTNSFRSHLGSIC